MRRPGVRDTAAVVACLLIASATAQGQSTATQHWAAAQLLSEQRAVAVKAWLVSEGVAAGRLLAVGYGASRPVRTDRKRNARIEVTRVQ
jgi:OOP family OmpA-OmpF porin